MDEAGEGGTEDEARPGAVAREVSLSRDGRISLLERFAPIPAAVLPLLAPLAWISDDLLALTILFGSQLAIAIWVLSMVGPGIAAWLATTRSSGRLPATFDGETLHVGGVSLRADELAMAWARRAREVEIVTQRGDELRIAFHRPEDAAALVEAVRRASDGRRAYPVRLEGDGLRLFRKVWSWLVPLTVATPFLWAGPAYGLPALAVGGLLGWLGARGTKRMRFGADGVTVEGRFRTRYVPYGDIARISMARTLLGWFTISIVTTDGGAITVGTLLGEARATLVRALLEEGVTMHAAGLAAGAHLAALDRGDEEADAWRVRVESATRDAGYRGAAMDAERLLSLMRNPAASSEQRVAAALALRSDPGGVARIRVAADVSAEPTVREAFEQLAAPELDEVELSKVLSRLERRAG